ncbi:hypothetical protein NC653_005913 [Populus alba x Populus x berolinensis]|uniref:Uncharacterized protein n=1 Tax=Populus alba x Populus x berolinensis TaxID=444605 RepID=A0AAD6WCF4_9ROSI|nr:hypothetical protein NC653_005913 [Populus alba x Populus x berolinensis]
MQKHTACILQSEASRYQGAHQLTVPGCHTNLFPEFNLQDKLYTTNSRKERKETAIEGPKKGRNGIEFFTGLACLNLLHYLEHC